MAGSPKKRAKKDAALRKFADPKFWDKVFDRIAIGLSLRECAAAHNIIFSQFYRTIHADPELERRLSVALQAKAFGKVDKIESDLRDVRTGEIDANAGRVLISGNQWLASKLDPDRWGDKSKVEVKVTDMTQLHLEAMRLLSRENEQVIDGEVIDEED